MFAASVSAQSVTDPKLVITPYLTGLTNPTGLRFTGPNEGFVIQKGGTTGTVRRFVNGSLTNVLSVPVASDDFERGLLGIALDPQYAANKHVYLYRSASANGSWTDNRLERYTFDGSALINPVTLGTFGTSSDGQAIGGNHNGGVLTFGSDGKLYGAIPLPAASIAGSPMACATRSGLRSTRSRAIFGTRRTGPAATTRSTSSRAR